MPDSPPRSDATARGHVPALDGVRGLAILLVLIFHLTLYTAPQPFTGRGIGGVAYAWAMNGWIGVDLFFVLSGFLITGILYDTRRRPDYFRNFYARRALRIFPLYFGFLFVAAMWSRVNAAALALSPANEGWYWTYTSNLMIALKGWPKDGALGHFWSLAVEEQFYLVWPWVVWLVGRRRLMIGCALLAVVALALRAFMPAFDGLVHPGTAAYVLMPARVDAFASGAFVALAARGSRGLDPGRRWAARLASLSAALLIGLAAVNGHLDPESRIIATAGYTLLLVGFAAGLTLTLTAPVSSRLRAVFSSRSLRFLGRYSYAIYVFHHPLLFMVSPLLFLELPGLSRFPVLARLAYALCIGALSIVAAVASWHGFEKHFIRLKDRFPAGHWTPVPASAGAP